MYVWDMPMYPAAEAARLVQLRPDRVRRWLKGYEYLYVPAGSVKAQRVKKAPVIQRRGAAGSTYASFLDLVDLLFVKRFLEYGFSLQKIRRALVEAEKIIGGHHFAQRCYFTDGRNIYLKVKNRGVENLMQLLSGGQWVIAEVIKHIAEQIDFDQATGFAEKWYPAGRGSRIVLDPRVCFGAPSIAGRGVRTANVLDLFLAESRKAANVAEWMQLDLQDVEAAVEFERVLAA
jgi:uncharacterized protein (DUF433 family)